jgi:hypothetical protein
MNDIDFLLNFDGDISELIQVCEYRLSLCDDEFQYLLC